MRRDVWLFLFAIGCLFFGWPIISIFQESTSFYLFIAWFVFITLIFIAATFSEREDNDS